MLLALKFTDFNVRNIKFTEIIFLVLKLMNLNAENIKFAEIIFLMLKSDLNSLKITYQINQMI